MKRLLYINWNVIGDSFTYLQEVHFRCLKKYNTLFDEVLVIINTDDIHNINFIHTTKREFDKIFGNRVRFKVEKNYDDQDNKMFERYFLPLINKYPNEYSMIYMMNDVKSMYSETKEHSLNNKLWIAAQYYLNFEYFSEHVDALLNKDYCISGSLLYNFKFNDGNYTITKHFSGGCYGISIVNMIKQYNKNSDLDRYKVRFSPESHFFTFIDYDKIHSDSHMKSVDVNNEDDNIMPPALNPFMNMYNILKDNMSLEDFNNIYKLAVE